MICIVLHMDFMLQLLLRLSMDHPYHTLSVLLALANAGKDDELSSGSSSSSTTGQKLSRKQSGNKKVTVAATPPSSSIDKVLYLTNQI